MDLDDKLASLYAGQFARRGGIPRDSCKYRFQGDYQNHFSRMTDSMVVIGNRILVSVIDEGIMVFDRRSGVVKQKKPIEGYSGGTGALRHNGLYIYVDPFLLDLKTLDVVYDPRPEFEAAGIIPKAGTAFINERYWVRELNHHTHPGVWWIFDLKEWKGKIEDVGALQPDEHFDCPEYVFCLVDDKVQIRDLRNASIVREKTVPDVDFIVSYPNGLTASDDIRKNYFLDMHSLDELGCLDPVNDKQVARFILYTDWFSPISIQRGMRFTKRQEMLYGFNWRTNELLWEAEIGRAGKFKIAGDLIFAGVNQSELVAIDKWSGEVVWRVDVGFEPLSIHFYQNDVYFINISGSMLCYEWEQEYISPNRPTDPNEAWIRPE